jgi:hypothetical protein
MDFAFCPDNGPPRLVRYVDQSVMPSDTTIAVYDARNNLLLVSHHLFEQLFTDQRERVLRTQAPFIEIA